MTLGETMILSDKRERYTVRINGWEIQCRQNVDRAARKIGYMVKRRVDGKDRRLECTEWVWANSRVFYFIEEMVVAGWCSCELAKKL